MITNPEGVGTTLGSFLHLKMYTSTPVQLARISRPSNDSCVHQGIANPSAILSRGEKGRGCAEWRSERQEDEEEKVVYMWGVPGFAVEPGTPREPTFRKLLTVVDEQTPLLLHFLLALSRCTTKESTNKGKTTAVSTFIGCVIPARRSDLHALAVLSLYYFCEPLHRGFHPWCRDRFHRCVGLSHRASNDPIQQQKVANAKKKRGYLFDPPEAAVYELQQRDR